MPGLSTRRVLGQPWTGVEPHMPRAGPPQGAVAASWTPPPPSLLPVGKESFLPPCSPFLHQLLGIPTLPKSCFSLPAPGGVHFFPSRCPIFIQARPLSRLPAPFSYCWSIKIQLRLQHPTGLWIALSPHKCPGPGRCRARTKESQSTTWQGPGLPLRAVCSSANGKGAIALVLVSGPQHHPKVSLEQNHGAVEKQVSSW